MKEFIEKLIGRLEEETIALEDNYGDLVECIPNNIVKKIVNQLAEEYKPKDDGFISRYEVLKLIEDIKCDKKIPKNYGTLLDIMRQVRKMPVLFATDENAGNNGWIACSERLPEKQGEYIVMIEGAIIPTCLTYNNISQTWYGIDYDALNYYSVVAWQPLPEPYKESEG